MVFSVVEAAGRAARAAAATLAIACVAVPAVAVAQVPGIPVLQNAFATPGLAVAANFGGGSGQSFYGAAAGWGLGSGRLQVSGAAGAQRIGEHTRGAYGARAAATLWGSRGGALGLGAFAGIGGAQRTRVGDVETNPAVIVIPAGVTVGYRRALGSHGLSIYGSPLFVWTRTTAESLTKTRGSFAGAAGVDYAFTQSLGATVGGQFGQSSVSSSDKNTGTIGLAISFVPGRR
jgi:hypothetical protein